MVLRVDASPIGIKLYQLLVFDEGQFIGEYERPQAADIDRKRQEVQNAEAQLRQIYLECREPFVVRWDGLNRKKSIRVHGSEVAEIQRSAWEKPSWE